MKESGYYPEGAEFDPRAPWNEREAPKEIVEVEVSLIVAKTLEVKLTEGYTSKDLWEAIKDELLLGGKVKLVTDEGQKSLGDWKVIEVDWEETNKK